MFACTFIGFISRCCSRLWLCSCFLLTILATAAAGGHYTYEIEFAGHTIFVKLAFKYLMRQAKGNAQRIAGSKIFECLVSPLFFLGASQKEGRTGRDDRTTGGKRFEQWTLIAQMKYWRMCVCVCEKGTREGSGHTAWPCWRRSGIHQNWWQPRMMHTRASCSQSSVGQSIKRPAQLHQSSEKGNPKPKTKWLFPETTGGRARAMHGV